MYRFYYTIAKNTIINHIIGCKLPHKIPYTLEGYLTRKLPDKYQKDIKYQIKLVRNYKRNKRKSQI